MAVFLLFSADRERRRFAVRFEKSTEGNDAGHGHELSW